MALERYDNQMGGETLVVPVGTALSKVPDDFRGLLTPEIEAAFVESRTFFKGLPKRAVLPEFKRWLSMLAATGLKAMELHTSDCIGNAVLFRFAPNSGMCPAITMPQPVAGLQLPDTLHSIYQVIGEIKHYGWEEAGGLSRAENICSITNACAWLNDELDEDPSQCHVFY